MESQNSLGNPVVKMTPPPKKPSLGTDSIKRAIDQMSQRENSIELVRAASQKQPEVKQITSLETPTKEEAPVTEVKAENHVEKEGKEEKEEDKVENHTEKAEVEEEEAKKDSETESPANSTPANEGTGSVDSDLNDVVGRESTDMDPLQPAGEEE